MNCKCFLLIFLILISSTLTDAQSLKDWQKNSIVWEQFTSKEHSIEKLLEIYIHNRLQIENRKSSPKEKSEAQLLNRYECIFWTGNYILQQQRDTAGLDPIFNIMEPISLQDSVLNEYIQKVGISKWIDHYCMLLALKNGATFDEARDGLTFTTKFKARAPNRYDYGKLRWIIENGRSEIQGIYLQKLKQIFRNYGGTEELFALYPIIVQRVQACEIKEDVIALYEKYERVRKNKLAPLFDCYDSNGEQFDWNKLKQKVIVLDVWATWCCSCIEKMPDFIKLQRHYKEREDIAFCTLSIDNRDAHQKWLNFIEENKMNELTNFIAYRNSSSFCKDYLIETVPRYIVIGKDGHLVNAFATGTYNEWIQLIDNLLR